MSHNSYFSSVLIIIRGFPRADAGQVLVIMHPEARGDGKERLLEAGLQGSGRQAGRQAGTEWEKGKGVEEERFQIQN